MKPSVEIIAAAEVRRALVPAGDIRQEIAFQNDINRIIGRLDEGDAGISAAEAAPIRSIADARKPLLLSSLLFRRRAA